MIKYYYKTQVQFALLIVFTFTPLGLLANPDYKSPYDAVLIAEGFPATALAIAPPITQDDLRMILTLLALQNGYPEKYITINYDPVHSDWTVSFGDKTTLYWANGRLLPLSQRPNNSNYRSYIGYLYSWHAIDMSKWSREQQERLLRNTSKTVQQNAPGFEGTFFKHLYGGVEKEDIEKNLTTIRFLGSYLKVHKLMAEAMMNVDKVVQKAAQTDSTLRDFLESLVPADSFSWRTIANSKSISYHSFAVAVDINPKKTTKPIYWSWERDRNSEWYLVPPDKRWNPHPTVIKAFQDAGFLWGGAWATYDNMHFEYRPELKELDRLFRMVQSK
jgi:hypothetical protein